MENLRIAIEASLKAGKEILDIYKTDDFEVDFKSDNSPLTKADRVSHEVIKSFLINTNIPILSEEGREIAYEERKGWNQLWIVDPIDGTKEFIKRNGEFTVNIALVENQVATLGVIYAPVLGDLYFSMKGLGSYKIHINSLEFDLDDLISRGTKLPVEREDSIFTIVASRSHMSPETQEFVDAMKAKHEHVELISKGSSLKLCMVAEGTANCYPRFAPTMEWDTAAGHAICLNAGFTVTDQKTQKPMLYNRENLLNNWFLVE
jgi:3'(2'), 5'-bisphosphate nucleotidase